MSEEAFCVIIAVLVVLFLEFKKDGYFRAL